MARAMELALLGRGSVSPNPLVGCVVVHEDKIIGEGWHQRYGGPHAEVNAIATVKDKSVLEKSTLYVNLEPCSHFGKTPPCADLLIREKVKKVVVANVDPNPLVAGQGIQKLRDAGAEVITGVLESEGRKLNSRFFTYIEQRRPYIILKWAETADGFIARENYDSKWISGPLSRQLVHRWRSEEDAILVGTKTALHDDPQLNVRDWTGRDPVRIVIDRQLSLPNSLKLFDGSQKTICFNHRQQLENVNVSYIRIDENDVIKQILNALYNLKIQSVIVEGGSQTLQMFLDSGSWDEARIFRAPAEFVRGIAAPRINGTVVSEDKVESDELTVVVRMQR